MTFSKQISHEMVSVVTLAVAIVALPFSMSVCHAGLFLLVFNWLIEGAWRRKWIAIKSNLLVYPFVLFLLLHLAGLFYSEDLANGWFNVEKKTFFFLLPLILATTPIRSSYLNLLLKLFIVTSFIAVMICLVVALFLALFSTELPPVFDYSNFEHFKSLNPGRSDWWSYFSYNTLASAIQIHPTYLGLYIVFSVALLFHFHKNAKLKISTWEKKSIIILFFLFSFFVMLLSSRAVIVAYLLVCFSGVVRLFNKKGNSFAIPALISLVILGSLTALVINPVSRFRFLQEFKLAPLSIESGRLYTTSSSIRFSLWWLGAKSIHKNNWVVGNGTGDVIDTVKDTATQYGISNTINSYDPHNQFIYTFLALGAAGVLCLIACLFFPFLPGVSCGYFLHRSFIAIIVIACMTESVFELQKGIIFFSIFHSLLLFHLQPSRFTEPKLSHA